MEAENEGTSPDKLATKRLMCMFTKEDGNCTPPRKEGIKLLDQKRILGIRCMFTYILIIYACYILIIILKKPECSVEHKPCALNEYTN